MKKPAADEINPDNDGEAKQTCGIIMPLAGSEHYEASHWQRVRSMIDEAIVAAGFVPKMVSDADEVSVIHGSIVQNIYDNPIVVCDVSSRNPNVMFELGMRLAFDKPTIIIKDNQTAYSFDTQVIEHIPYRTDLRYDDVRDFQVKLTQKILATIDKKGKDESYSPFLRHFKHLVPQKLGSQEVPVSDFILSRLDQIQLQLAGIRRREQHGVYNDFAIMSPLEIDIVSDIATHIGSLASKGNEIPSSAIKKNIVSMISRKHPSIAPERLEGLFERAWALSAQARDGKYELPNWAFPERAKEKF